MVAISLSSKLFRTKLSSLTLSNSWRMGDFHSWSEEIWFYIIFCFTQNLFRFLDCILQSCAIDSRFLHETVLKSCLLRSTKSRIHSLWQFDKLVTNCTKRVHKTVLIWGTLEMGSMKYLWVKWQYTIKMNSQSLSCVQVSLFWYSEINKTDNYRRTTVRL